MKNSFTKIASGILIAAAALALPFSTLAATLTSDSFGTVLVSNFTRNPGSNAAWSTSGSAAAGETVAFGVYYHNAGSTTAHNVVVHLSTPGSGSASSYTLNGSVTSSDAATISGSATVNLSTAQTLTFNGNVFWDQNTTGNGPTLPGGAAVLAGGVNIGDVGPGEFGTVVVHFTVGQQQQQVQLDPNVNTLSATNILQNSATLNGTVDGRGTTSSTCFFELFGSTGSLNQTVNVNSSGTGFQNLSSNVSNLNPNTIYSYRLSCNGNGRLVQGNTVSFVTPGQQNVQQDPIVTTISASNIQQNSATLNGSVDGRGTTSSTCFFEVFGPNGSLNQQVNVGSTNTGFQNVSSTVFGLNSNTSYTFRLSCNANGRLIQGQTLSFITGSQNNFQQDPLVTTLPATNIAQNSGTLNGTVDGRGVTASSCFFEFGPTTNFGQTLSVGSAGTGFQNFTQTAFNLNSNSTYFFRLNCSANGRNVPGQTLSFQTGNFNNNNFQQDPIVTTLPATNISGNSATLNGLVDNRNTNSNFTSCFFEYGPTTNFGFNTQIQTATFSQTNLSSFVSNLNNGGTTFFRVSCNANGRTIVGQTLSFNSNGVFNNGNLQVTTNNATEIFSDSARLNGLITSPQVTSLTGWFEYGTFGNLNQQTAAQNLGTGNTSTYSRVVLSLLPNTTYSFRAVAQDSTGRQVRGNILTFTTAPRPQVITTVINTPVINVVTPQAIQSPIIISYGMDNVHPNPGDLVTYRVGWTNSSGVKLSSAILRIGMPAGLIFLDSASGVARDGSNILYPIGNLNSGASGFIFFRATVDRSVPIGTDLPMALQINFFNTATGKNGDVTITGFTRVGGDFNPNNNQFLQQQPQQQQPVVTPNNTTVPATTVTPATTDTTNTNTSFFGSAASFFPETAVGWLLLLLLIIAIIAVIAQAVRRKA